MRAVIDSSFWGLLCCPPVTTVEGVDPRASIWMIPNHEFNCKPSRVGVKCPLFKH